ncbi:MAG: hypothetical protein KDE27_23920 [Planctomycetes bacterium]|nr:hypothetical protein [Planctomycetota bacterium]
MMHRPLALLALCSPLAAQSIVVPTAAEFVSQLPGGYTTLLRSAARTYVVAIEASELAGIPIGEAIVGMSFRCGTNTVQPYPNQSGGSLDYADFTISLGPCVPPASITSGGSPAPLISSIWIGTPTVARSGPLSIPNGTFVHNNVSPPPFSEYYFEFDTPVVYPGGDFAILIERSASNNSATGTFEGAPNGYRAGNYAFGNSVDHGLELAYVNTPLITRLHHGYGAGCAGSNGRAPICIQNANVTGGQGGAIRLTGTNAPPNAVGVLALGFGRATQPLGNGCDLLLNVLTTVFVTFDAAGETATALQLPGGYSLTFNAQYAVLDAGATGGFTVSNAVEPILN